MSVVITVAQQKGGAGKTTLAANLAAALAGEARVAVLDIDPQRNPFGLALDCFSGAPQRIEPPAAEPVQGGKP